MSHVISAQPSATSPYQPTAMQEGNGADNPPRIHRIDSEQHDDCCIHTRNKKGCCLFVCTLLSMCCQGIKNCTESCCDCCANSLNDCCEDKPRERNQRIYHKRYKNSGGSYYDNTTDNNDDWGISSLSAQHMHVGVSNHASEPAQDLMPNLNDDYNSSTQHKSGHDSATLPLSGHHDSAKHHPSGQDSVTHHSTGCHNLGTHHSSSHHDSGTTHSSSHHDSGTHHSSSHDTGGGFDSGGGCDSGGGDTGGGCDSGGGGCDD